MVLDILNVENAFRQESVGGRVEESRFEDQVDGRQDYFLNVSELEDLRQPSLFLEVSIIHIISGRLTPYYYIYQIIKG